MMHKLKSPILAKTAALEIIFTGNPVRYEPLSYSRNVFLLVQIAICINNLVE